MTDKRIIARFHPQAWVNDYAVAVDPEGPVEFDVTDAIRRRGKEEALAIRDDDYESDSLRYVKTAPQWIQEWSGPFYVEVAQQIADFYEEDSP